MEPTQKLVLLVIAAAEWIGGREHIEVGWMWFECCLNSQAD